MYDIFTSPRTTLSCNDARSGFSLVELSIVLLIIGMLVSGVLVGRDMIRAAELRSIVTDKDRIQTAVNLFQQKYLGLPGDLINATSFWGPMTNCTTTASGTGTQTCNGNGDGMIGWGNTSGYSYEMLSFWQHLSNSGLIEGKYTGVWSGTSGSANQELAGKIKNTTWSSFFFGNIVLANTNWFEGQYGNVLNLFLGNLSPVLISPSEMWNIDKKIDDGLPGLGNVVSGESNANCNTTTIASTAEYNLIYTENACAPAFKKIW